MRLITLRIGLLLAAMAGDAAAGGSARCRIVDYRARVEAGDAAGAEAIVTSMRAQHHDLFEELFQERDRMRAEWEALANSGDPAAETAAVHLTQVDELIDRVGGARYCTVSRLYWHTDLDEARNASRASGKPILSLRMLGRLTDELSCANSRFFRTTLYSNAEIARVLREHFILHWESVRPVPVITIDFGDGRSMTRTITGNSAHYVLDCEGTPVDCLPGLYSPQEFLAWLARVEPVAQAVIAERSRRSEILNAYHAARMEAIDGALPVIATTTTAAAVPGTILPVTTPQTESTPPHGTVAVIEEIPGDAAALVAAQPTAVEAAARAVPKSIVELPALANLDPEAAAAALDLPEEELWRTMADAIVDTVVLDDASRALIISENPTATDAARVAITKRDIEGPILAAMFDRLQRNIALDTARNEYDLHRRIHEWFVNEGPPDDLAAFNERVYAELFLTPSSDPWLGMLDREVYTGLTNAGVVHSAQ